MRRINASIISAGSRFGAMGKEAEVSGSGKLTGVAKRNQRQADSRTKFGAVAASPGNVSEFEVGLFGAGRAPGEADHQRLRNRTKGLQGFHLQSNFLDLGPSHPRAWVA